jgi:hypothetical protein
LSNNLKDPATWPYPLPPNIKDRIVIQGAPDIICKDYPVDSKKRCFSHKALLMEFNGKIVKRLWLLYSESTDAVFCLYCKLAFPNSKIKFIKDGINDWKNLFSIIRKHEKSNKHEEALKDFNTLCNALYNNATINFESEESRQV